MIRAPGDILSGLTQAFMRDGCELEQYSYHPHRPCIPIAVYVSAVLWLGLIVFFLIRLPNAQFVPASEGFNTATIRVIEDAKIGFYGAKGVGVITSGPYENCRVMFMVSPDLDDDFIPRAQESYYIEFTWLNVQDIHRKACYTLGCIGQVRASKMDLLNPEGVVGHIAQIRASALQTIRDVLPQPSMGRALVLALVFGDRTELQTDGLYDAIKTLGLAHLVAVSGAHLSIVSAVLAVCIQKLPLSRRSVIGILCLMMAVYVVLTGCGPSVIRAAIMSCLGLVSVLAKRRAFTLSSLAICVTVMLAFNPPNAFSLSFTLSVLSTAGIIVYTPLFSSWLSSLTGESFKTLRDVVAMTCAANLTTLPISTVLFSRIPLMGVLTNAAASAFLGAYLPFTLVVVLVALIVEPWAHILLSAPTIAAQCFGVVSVWVSGFPGVSMPVLVHPFLISVVSIVFVVGLWIWWPELSRQTVLTGFLALCSVLLVIGTIISVSGKDEIIALDIGQGDAILVSSQGRRVLIDTGRNDTLLLQALARHHIYSLDAVVITHHDEDHYGSLPALRGTVKIGAIYVAQEGLTCPCEQCDAMRDSIRAIAHTPLKGLEVGDVFHVGVIDLLVVWPHQFQDQGGNCDSVCMLGLYDGNHDGMSDITTFLSGDAENDVVQALLDEHVLGDIDIYKVGHHGSKNALTDEQAQILDAEVSVVSVGERNRYGHPSPITLDILQEAHSEIYRTDKNGDVSCIMRRQGLKVVTLR